MNRLGELTTWVLWWIVALYPAPVIQALSEFWKSAMWVVDSVWIAATPYLWSAAPLAVVWLSMIAWWLITQAVLDKIWVVNQYIRPFLIAWWWIATVLSWLAPYMVWWVAAFLATKYWRKFSSAVFEKIWEWTKATWRGFNKLLRALNPWSWWPAQSPAT